MKGLFTIVLLLAMLIDPTKIGKINALKSEAKKAYLAGDFKTAIEKYRFLVDSLQVQEDEVLLNLANSYFQLNDTTNAVNQYQTLTQSSKNQLRSKAEQQLGVMANRQGKFEEALSHFKQAIKSDQTNEDARYNYELLKKKLEEEKKKQEQQKQEQNKEENKDQENKEDQKKDQQNKKDQKKDKEEQKKDQQQKDEEQKDNEQKKKEQEQEQNKDQKQDQEKKDTPPAVKEKLQQMQMSEQKAKMILEAMKNQELQYLQQNKRKATKPKDRGKPDW